MLQLDEQLLTVIASSYVAFKLGNCWQQPLLLAAMLQAAARRVIAAVKASSYVAGRQAITGSNHKQVCQKRTDVYILQ